MKIRVMVVEDEPPIQRSICQKIEETNKNFTVVAAIDNGKDALQYLKEHPGEHYYDASTHVLPVMQAVAKHKILALR